MRFLQERANGNISSAIEGSWAVPDIRATSPLKNVLLAAQIGFSEARANILGHKNARLVILRKISDFSESLPKERWKSRSVAANEELVKYLTYIGEVAP